MQPAVVNDTPGKLLVHVYGYNHQFILHTCNVCIVTHGRQAFVYIYVRHSLGHGGLNTQHTVN